MLRHILSRRFSLVTTVGALAGAMLPVRADISIAPLAWDGSQFWAGDYSGLNQGYRIDTSGHITKTVTFGLAGGFMDGLEYFDGKLIVSRGNLSGTFDIYDLDGNVLSPAFISTGKPSTGIAFDGTNFLVSYFNSDFSVNRFGVYSGNTGALLKTIHLGLPVGNTPDRLIEDLSMDYVLPSNDVVYGNNASYVGDYIEKFDLSTDPALVLQTYHPSSGNGRGVAVIDNVLYATTAGVGFPFPGDNHIYKVDARTGAPLGVITVTSATIGAVPDSGSTLNLLAMAWAFGAVIHRLRLRACHESPTEIEDWRKGRDSNSR